jgi:hypothetical protein
MVDIKLAKHLFVFILTMPSITYAVTLDETFANIDTCRFPKNFYYAGWDTTTPVYSYFSERNLKPYKEENGLYFFKIKDTLFGLPVSELFVPGTWDYHGIVFDAPLERVQAVIKRKFGSTFAPSEESIKGISPALEKYIHAPNKAGLYCNEVEGGVE